MFKVNLWRKVAICCLLVLVAAFITQKQPDRVLGAGAPTLVQSKDAKSGTTTSVTATFSNNVVAGNVVAVAAGSGGSASITSITSTCVTGSLTVVDNDTATLPLGLAYGSISASGPCSVTANFSGSGNGNIIMIHEINGVSTTLDGHNTKLNSFGTSPAVSTAITTTVNGDYVFGAAYAASGLTYTASSGFTERVNQSTYASEDQVQSAAGSITSSFVPSANASHRVGIIAFQPSSGAPPDTTAPTVPSGLSASAVSQSQINLSWTVSSDNVGVTGYTIYRGGVQVGTTIANNYNDNGLTASTAYTYTVDAFDAAGNHSSQSTSASATTQSPPPPDTTPPSTPTNLTATAISSSGINLSWTASTDNVAVTGYKIFRGGSQIGTSATNSYSDSGLTASTLYSYTVSAFDAANNNSSQSTSTSAITQAAGSGHTYTVKTGGGGNYTTIQACANVAVGGDTCVVYAGTYSGWTQSTNGTAGNLITFKKHVGDTVVINSGISLGSSSYVAIGGALASEGFEITEGTTWTQMSHVTIQNNYVHNTSGRCFQGPNSGNFSAPGSSFNAWLNNIITFCGNATAQGFFLEGNNNLFDGNTISHVEDGMALYGGNNVVRNNHFGPVISTEYGTAHPDAFESSATCVSGNFDIPLTRLVFENNVIQDWGVSSIGANASGANTHSFLLRDSNNCGQMNQIIRFNRSLNVGSYYMANDVDSRGERIYNETVRWTGTQDNTANTWTNGDTDAKAINNMFIDMSNFGNVTWCLYVDGTSMPGFVEHNNLCYNDGYSGAWKGPPSGTSANQYSLTDKFNQNPLLVSNSDPHLQSGSPAIVAGGSLTNVASSDSGTGTTLVVNDANFFQDGYGISGVQPDCVAVGTVSNVACIQSINYGTNTITLTSSISRSAGQPIYLYKNSSGTVVLTGSAPDIGAFPFTSGGGPDTTPPSTPSNLSASAISASQINLSWTASTDNVGVTGYKIFRNGSQVGTSATNSYSDSGLSAGTSYSYNVSAYDAASNNSSQSSPASATTQSLPDTTAPTISITAPVNGATVGGSITISATASDPVVAGQITSGVALVTVSVDGSVYATSSSGSLSAVLDTTTLTNASHTITAVARDNAGNQSPPATVAITVNNASAQKFPRLVKLTSLEGRATIPVGTTITATVLSPSSGTPLETQTGLAPDAQGNYTVTFLGTDPQLVSIRIKANGYLSQLLTNIDTTQNTSTALTVPQLSAGDFNNDNVINTLDFSLMNTHWLQNNPATDINGDGLVNSLDYAVLKNNFGKSGQ